MEIITSVAFGVRSQSQTVENDPLTAKAREAFGNKLLFLFSGKERIQPARPAKYDRYMVGFGP